MQRLSHCGLILGASLLIAGCSSNAAKLASSHEFTGGLWSLTVSSSAFKDGKPIPKLFTADGSNFSPPLRWSKAPDPTQEYVLIVEDPDAPGNQPFMHWLVYDIPAAATSLPQGISPPGNPLAGAPLHGVEGKNSAGKIGYFGPKPPPGKPHRYFFQLFAIDDALNLPAGADKQTVMNAMEDHIIAKGVLVGKYQR